MWSGRTTQASIRKGNRRRARRTASRSTSTCATSRSERRLSRFKVKKKAPPGTRLRRYSGIKRVCACIRERRNALRCSALRSLEQRYLIIRGLRSPRIYIVDTKPDPTRAEIHKITEPEEVFKQTDYSRHHTVRCGPEGIYVSALGGGKHGTAGPPGIFIMDCENVRYHGPAGDWPRAPEPALRLSAGAIKTGLYLRPNNVLYTPRPGSQKTDELRVPRRIGPWRSGGIAAPAIKSFEPRGAFNGGC